MLGAFVAWWFTENLGWSIWMAFLAAMGVAVLVGLVIERLALRPLIGQPILAAVMMTLALAQFIQGAVILVFGAYQRSLPTMFPLQPLILGDVRLKLNLVLAFAVALIGFAVFVLFFRFTRAGLAMRARSRRPSTRAERGVERAAYFWIGVGDCQCSGDDRRCFAGEHQRRRN